MSLCQCVSVCVPGTGISRLRVFVFCVEFYMLLKLMIYILPFSHTSCPYQSHPLNLRDRHSLHQYGIDTFQQRWPEGGILHLDPNLPIIGFNLRQKVDCF